MPLATVTRRIGANTYVIRRLGTTQALEVAEVVIGVLGPSIAAVLAGVKVDSKTTLESLLGQDLGLAGLISTASDRLSRPGSLRQLGELFQGSTDVKLGDKTLGLPEIYESHFAGALDEWAGWVRACMEVNFARFFAMRGSAQSATAG